MTLILNNDQIADLVSMQDCVDVLEDAFVELAEGRGAYRRRSDICTPSTHPSGGMYALKSMDGVVPKLGVGAIEGLSQLVQDGKLRALVVTGETRSHSLPTCPR